MTDMRRNRLPAFMRRPVMAVPVVNVAPEITTGPKSDGEVWLAAWCAMAQSSVTIDMDVAISWADKCLVQYRLRFPK